MSQKKKNPPALYAMSFTVEQLTQILQGLHYARVLLSERNEISPPLEEQIRRFTKARDSLTEKVGY